MLFRWRVRSLSSVRWKCLAYFDNPVVGICCRSDSAHIVLLCSTVSERARVFEEGRSNLVGVENCPFAS